MAKKTGTVLYCTWKQESRIHNWPLGIARLKLEEKVFIHVMVIGMLSQGPRNDDGKTMKMTEIFPSEPSPPMTTAQTSFGIKNLGEIWYQHNPLYQYQLLRRYQIDKN